MDTTHLPMLLAVDPETILISGVSTLAGVVALLYRRITLAEDKCQKDREMCEQRLMKLLEQISGKNLDV